MLPSLVPNSNQVSMKKTLPILVSMLLVSTTGFAADVVLNIPMESNGKSQVETSKGNILTIRGKHTNENIAGAVGEALRFDGYSTYVTGSIPSFSPSGSMSVSMWVAPETYPVIDADKATQAKIRLAGTQDDTSANGWAFNLGNTGKYSFSFFSDSWPVTVDAEDNLPCYEWSFLCAVIDMDSMKVTLYRNGTKVGEKNTMGSINNNATSITIGRSAGGSQFGSIFYDTFNGLIDDITIYNGVLSTNEMAATPQNVADLSIPESRFENDLVRPKYHGMPAANWTNECHGMTYSNGRYHLFFQKNANGPYMARLHWGHISSENLYEWTEEPIAIAPGESYDIKGCWSGCVFTDDEITGGKPNIIYTGVDYERAYIVQASPLDDDLIDWQKKGVIINGRPEGLSDDFRDPYFFRDGDNAYIIVGTSKNNLGAATLHKYNKATKTWSNDGKIFFQAKDLSSEGRFWEMPNLTKMENGKWLFTVTPIDQSNGVHTIYWMGEIAADGTFVPDSPNAQKLELISKEGYGLLSPTMFQHDGKTLLLGIVPDKISIDDNSTLGWAHLYSFPREISVDENGNMVQKPSSKLKGLRGDESFHAQNLTLTDVTPLTGVSGRQFEIDADFVVGNVPFGFNFLKNSRGAAILTYNPTLNQIKFDVTGINRINNDRGVFDGVYSATLPVKPEPGSTLKLNVFLDGSIVDIFVNDTYATSVRVFPNAADANGVEAFANGGNVTVKRLDAWNLDSNASGNNDNDNDSGIDEIFQDLPEYLNVYSINGMIIKSNVKASEALNGLPKGIYLINKKKIVI